MAQHDYDIANQSFPSFRSDLNSVLEAINTSNSGTSRPSSAVAGTIWLDSTNATNPTLKFFDGSDDISLATLDYTANTVNWLDSTVSVNIVSDTTPQLGGDLDVNGNDIVSVSNGNITFTPDGTGKVIIDGLSYPTADGTSGQFLKTDGAGNLSFDTVTTAGTVLTTQGDILYRDGSGLARLGAGTSGQLLQTNGTGSNPSWVDAGGGIEMAQQWRLTANFTGSQEPITSNLEIADTYGYGTLGSSMTESSGIFTFPSTGHYLIITNHGISNTNFERGASMNIYTTTDGTNYNQAAQSANAVTPSSGANTIQYSSSFFIFDVTNTSTHKIQFQVNVITTGSTVTRGDTNYTETGFTFIRLGDT